MSNCPAASLRWECGSENAGAISLMAQGKKMFQTLSYYWNTARGYRLTPWRSPYLRWRFETFLGNDRRGDCQSVGAQSACCHRPSGSGDLDDLPRAHRRTGHRRPAEESEVSEFFGNDPTCLESLRNDLKAERTTLRLFLEEEPRRDFAKHMVRLAENGGLTEDFINGFWASYFPKDFVIADACITNAPFIWFHKHFWM